MNSTGTPGTASEKAEAWSGWDVSKETFNAALWLPLEQGEARSMQEIPERQFARVAKGVREFLVWMDGLLAAYAQKHGRGAPTVRAVMEATGKYSVELAAWVLAERPSLAPAIINPQRASHYARSLCLQNTTDRISARALARYGAERQPGAHEPLSKERAELRDSTRYRQTLVEQRVEERNRASEGSESPFVRAMQRERLGQLTRDIRRIEADIKRVVKTLPAALQRDIKKIDSIYGIGPITAATIIAELGDLRRFKRARQVSAIAGLSPRNVVSGTSVHKKAHLSKKGSTHVRHALYMPAVTVIRGDNDLADLYKRLTAKGKPKMAALGAVMRKLLLLCRAVVLSDEPYQRHYKRSAKPGEQAVDRKAVSP